MASMAVTLEVSKLSGWLKAVADCRVEGRACDAGGERCEPGGGRACVVWWRHDKRHARGPTQGLGAKGTRGAHAEHVAHVRDAGGVKAQRLVEGRRALPSRGEGMRCGGRGARRKAGGPVGWWRHTRGMLHGARLKAWGPRARAERTLNMSRMSVTLEVSKLSGWLKFDARCRVEGRACDAGGERWEPGGGRACGVVAARQAACTGGTGPTQGLGAKGTRGERTSNILNMVVTLEVSKLSGWLKADAVCRVEGRACDAGGREVRAGRRESLWCGGGTQEACTGKRPDSRLGGQGHAWSAPGTCSSCP